jgi:hypothetical protein
LQIDMATAKNKVGFGIKLLSNIFEIWQHHEPSES